jgi:hypothetical protein
MAALLLLGVFFLDHFLKRVQFLAQLREGLLYGIEFLSAFISGAEIGFFRSVFLKPTAISSIVRLERAPTLLAKVLVFLGTSFLWTLAVASVPGRFVPFFLLCNTFSSQIFWIFPGHIRDR